MTDQLETLRARLENGCLDFHTVPQKDGRLFRAHCRLCNMPGMTFPKEDNPPDGKAAESITHAESCPVAMLRAMLGLR